MHRKGIFPLLLLFLATFANGSLDEKRLQEDLIRGYNRLVRPVYHNSDKLVVKFGIRLIQILDVDEKNQILTTNLWLKHEWRESFQRAVAFVLRNLIGLTEQAFCPIVIVMPRHWNAPFTVICLDINLIWDPEKYNNLKSVSVPSSSIWVPDVILYNSADGKYEVTLMTRANVSFDGRVIWEPPAIFKSSCTINVEFFPFDVQLCTMKFGSWTYDFFQVDLVHSSQTFTETGELVSDYISIGMDLTDFYQSHEWDIMSVPARRSVEVKNTLSEEFYPDITFNITLRRKTLFYTCNLIIPCVGLSFLTVLTFYLPSESGEKISLCISILLSLTVFVLLLNDLIPPTSLVVPLIGKYLLFTIILVTLSILVTVVVLNIHFRSPSTHVMPKWARRLFLHVLPRLLLMKRPLPSTSLSPIFYTKELAQSFLKESNDVLDYTSFMNNKQKDYVSKMNSAKMPLQKLVFGNRQEHLYHLEKLEAITAVSDMIDHLRQDDEENRVREEWKYTALVIDRLFLLIFTSACLAGTVSIILQAPSFYDKIVPIDEQMSTRFSKPTSFFN